ncbi:MAG: DUF1566 domain-containing protein [Prevotellaceae bacterium]|nr:DUF1566 domain-containing protein [Prevotellaceae bacterium]
MKENCDANFDRSVGGYSEWRVPTIQELQAIYNLRNQIGGFKAAPYWSSTEVYSDDIWYYYLDFSTCLLIQKLFVLPPL